jgi:hypothetical protein
MILKNAQPKAGGVYCLTDADSEAATSFASSSLIVEIRDKLFYNQ